MDFAHTPNALRAALEAARALKGERGRVIAVFGSAGLRDREKRRAACGDGRGPGGPDRPDRRGSAHRIAFLHSRGNGRRRAVPGRAWKEKRSSAFRTAARRCVLPCNRPAKETCVIACGKGHEQSMCFGEVEYPWDDRRALRAALAGRLGVPGPDMPALPTSDGVKEEI